MPMDKIKAGRFATYIANLYFKLQILLLFLLLIYLFDFVLLGHYSSEGYQHFVKIINLYLLEKYGN